MQQTLNQKIILHNIKSIRDNLESIENATIKDYNTKAQKEIRKIKKELEKLEFYYKSELNQEKIDFPIKKQITIKNKKTSDSFAKWLFNNKEI